MAFNIFNEFGEPSPAFKYLDEAKADSKIFEAAGDDSSSVADFADKQLRSQGMACVLGWVDGGDFSADALDVIVQGFSDLDGDGEVQAGGDEENYYNDLYGAVAEAMAALGADVDAIGSFIDDADQSSGDSIGSGLAGKVLALDQSDDEIISGYAAGSGAEPIMESGKFVVKGGMKFFKKKRLHKIKLSSAQRAGMKKMRLKAHSASANRARMKSLKKGKKMGLYH